MEKRPGSPSSSEAEHVKRQRLSKLLDPAKIGFYCRAESGDYTEFQFFLLDLGADGDSGDVYPKIDPEIRIYGLGDDVRTSQMCVCDSTLYVFEGLTDMNDIVSTEARRAVWKLPLSDEKLTPREDYSKHIEEDNSMFIEKLDRARDMHLPKYDPIPIPISTPSGRKILVISSIMLNTTERYKSTDRAPICDPEVYDISKDDSWMIEPEFAPVCDTELYDITKDSWEKLPILPANIPISRSTNRLFSFSLLGDSCLIINTEFGVYFMDFKLTNLVWDRVDIPYFHPFFGNFVTIKDQYILSPKLLWDLKQDLRGGQLSEWKWDEKAFVEWPLSSLDPSVQSEYDLNPHPDILLVDLVDSTCCNLVSQVQMLQDVNYMILRWLG